MSATRRRSAFEAPTRFVLDRTFSLARKTYRFEPVVRFVSARLIVLPVKLVERFVPDRVLLLLMNVLDKHVPPKAIDVVIDEVDKHVPPSVLSTLIAAADEYVPDTAASSRKFTTMVAGVGKYIPDRIIPPESLDQWSNLKMKFHIPTLLSRGRADSRKK